MKFCHVLFKDLKKSPYIAVNVSLAGIIFMIFIYAALFSPEKNNYPVTCIHEQLTGEPCVSCGLSHSFSLTIRMRFGEAQTWNPYGLRVFMFFLIQMVMRITLPIAYLKFQGLRKQLIIFDAVISSIMFFFSFYPFLKYIFRSL